ncbi:MAG TPA: DUF87 domain-containing protein [Bryobacteraceae bacterium]|nr:DUF87 domain-containing protein [Bryobacteraceae bacterium]
MEPLPLGILDDTFERGSVFTVLPEHRRKHMAVFGTTGSGKTTLIRNAVAWDISSGLGVTVIDPHGDLVRDIMENHIPRERTNDVIYCNPADPERSFAINILESVDSAARPLAVSQAVEIFHKLYQESWGPRLEDILRNSLFALIEQPQPVSLAALPKLLSDPDYRAAVLSNVTNPIVLDFFQQNYEQWKDGFREEAISAVLNKIRAFLTNPLLLSILGQRKSSFDFRWAMDHHKIILVDLSKGAIGEDSANLLGSLFVAKEKLAALSRANQPEHQRQPHVLYVDEAQNFVGDFPSILQEARKYALVLVIVTQGIEQLSEDAAFAVFTNCATLVSYRVSGHDAERLKFEFATVLPASSLQDMSNYKLYVRTLITDEHNTVRPSGPHVLKAYPPLRKGARDNHVAAVLRTSRERFTRPREEVDAAIRRFIARKYKVRSSAA